jgi:hypothetical protein
MDEFEFLIIDKDNSAFMVRQTTKGWFANLFYKIPHRTKTGKIGARDCEDQKEFVNEVSALECYENWKKEYYTKLQNQEIIELEIEYLPVNYYFITCPKCGKDAEILNSIIFCDEEADGLAICCEHCSEVESPYLFERLMGNQVGVCEDTSFFYQDAELRFHSSIDVEGMTWDEFEGLK